MADALKDLAGQPAGEAAISRAFAPEPGGSLVVLAGFNAGQNLLVGGFSPARLFEAGLAGAIDPSQATALVLAQHGGQVLYSMGIQDPPGQVPAHPGIADALEGQSGINYFQAADGEHVVAFSPISVAGWALVIEEPWEKSASPFLSTTQAAPLVLLPVLVLAFIALWFGARRVIQPLQALENRAAALANGDFEAIQQPVGGISEIRQLQAELVDMAGKVKTAQESLHGYIGAMTAGTETERRSLARELHDDTIQSLIAINQRIQLTLPNARDDAERSALVELQGLAQEAMTDLRRMIRGLRPIYLEDLGLAAALRMLAQEVSQSSGLPVQFQETGSERRLEPAVELAFYRMAQEALSNSVRHAHARAGQGRAGLLPGRA